MPVYTVQAPDGNTYDIEGPEGASIDDLKRVITEIENTVKPYDVPSPVASMMNIGNAVTFGFGDEIAGKLGADKQRYEATINKFRKDYPALSAIGTVSGSMLLPFAGPKAFSAAHPYITAATIGGAGGALQAMGDATDVESGIPQSALAGGAGMLAGPLLGFGLSTGGNVMSALGARAKSSWADDVARRRIADAFRRDNTDAEAVGRRMVELGPEARFADAAGENTRSALDVNASLPGRTKDLLENTIRNRQATSFDRLNDSVVYTLSGGYGRAKDLVKSLSEQQKKVAGPLYDKAHSSYIPADNELIDILDAAKRLGAFGEAKTIATAERSPFTLENMTAGDVSTSVNRLTNQPTQKVKDASQLAIKDIDYVKRGLDSMIEKETNEFGKVSSKGRAYIGLKEALLGRVDTLSDDFAKARQAFAGPAALKSAVDRGKRFWRDEPTRLEDEIAGMTQSEQEAFRVGAAEALRLKVGSERGRSELLNMWKDNNIQERMRALLGSDVKYADVSRMINNEGILKRLTTLGRGSQTFARGAAAEEQGLEVAGDMINMGIGKTGVLNGLISSIQKNAPRITTPEPVRDAMGNILLRQYQPAEMQALLKAQQEIMRLRALAAGSGGIAGAKGTAGATGLLDD